ncbi:MAG: hypothetical protein RL738_934 [Bacteroidota bacterium]
MLRILLWFFAGGILTACTTRRTEHYALAQNPSVLHSATLHRRPSGAAFKQSYPGITNWVGMDRLGNLRRHQLATGEGIQTSYVDRGELVLPLGRVPAPQDLKHLSSLAVLPLLVPELQRLAQDARYDHPASTAPAGDLVEVEWICTRRTSTERHYVARYEVTTAELRYERRFGRWRLASAEYSEREFVQRWNRIPQR